jgi:hypothetical protein
MSCAKGPFTMTGTQPDCHGTLAGHPTSSCRGFPQRLKTRPHARRRKSSCRADGAGCARAGAPGRTSPVGVVVHLSARRKRHWSLKFRRSVFPRWERHPKPAIPSHDQPSDRASQTARERRPAHSPCVGSCLDEAVNACCHGSHRQVPCRWFSRRTALDAAATRRSVTDGSSTMLHGHVVSVRQLVKRLERRLLAELVAAGNDNLRLANGRDTFALAASRQPGTQASSRSPRL